MVYGSNPSGDEVFCMWADILTLTQPPIHWVPCHSWGKLARA